MKKFLTILGTAVLSAVLLAGCGGSGDSADGGKGDAAVITVGASPAPHAEILEAVKPILAEKNIDLQIKEFNDYILPNTATESGEIDANYFQHGPYLEDFNNENGTHLVSVAAIHYEPFGLYAGKVAALDELGDGATIAVPNDGTNEARALMLLEAQGLITLKEDAGFTATKLDIVDNPKNINIQEMEAAQIARALADVDMAVINGNYAIEAGLKVSDAVAVEDKDSEAAQTYANVLVVKEGNENNEAVQALAEALQSDEIKKFMEDKYAGAVVPIF